MRGRITCLEGSVETVALPAGHRGEPGHAGNGGGRRPAGESSGMPRRRSSQRLEKAQEAAFTALAAVSSYLDSDEDLPVFFGRLSETRAGPVPAPRAGSWRPGPPTLPTPPPPPSRFSPPSPPPHHLT